MQTIPTLLETAMNEHDDAPSDGAGSAQDRSPDQGDAATRSLPVLVEFELGRLELTMGELAGLQPGYVFPLPAFVEGANVTIRANGRVSGRGELVAVGDTLGVRLVSWN
jgi:type III secretion protein Q